ncbi:MAG: hypothetical protein NC218_10255 [Acetobacter sp.]|nr:hypothetical protein [Acetobacter sp.]
MTQKSKRDDSEKQGEGKKRFAMAGEEVRIVGFEVGGKWKIIFADDEKSLYIWRL